MSGCGAEIGAAPGGRKIPETPDAGIPPENMASPTADAGAATLPQIDLVRKVDVSGSLQTLIAGQNGCYAINQVPDGLKQKTRVSFVEENGNTTAPVDLPGGVQRSYGFALRLSNGNLALLYQSTNAPSFGQDGTQHGVLVLNSAGGLLAEHNLYAKNLTRPSALLERNGKLLVLANNGETTLDQNYQVVFKNPSSLVIIDNPASAASPIKVIHLPDGYNAGALALRKNQGKDELVVAAAGAYLSNKAVTRVITLDPNTFQVTDTHYDAAAGIGLNGAAAVQGDRVLLTGSSAPGHSIAIFANNQLSVIPLMLAPQTNPDAHGQAYVPGAQFVGEAIFFSAQQQVGEAQHVQTRLADRNGQNVLLDDVAALFPVAPVAYGQKTYCSGAANTTRFESRVQFWRAQ